jgi:hypothetical protein
MVYDRMLTEAVGRLVPAAGMDASGVYASLIDLAARMLEDLASGHAHADPAWCYQVVQVQLPAWREVAGFTLAPALRGEPGYAGLEADLRERHGVPAPDA